MLEKGPWFCKIVVSTSVPAVPELGLVAVVQGQGEDAQDVQAAGQKLLPAEGDARVWVAWNNLQPAQHFVQKLGRVISSIKRMRGIYDPDNTC